VLKPVGRFILNISDRIRNRRIKPVSEWHLSALRNLGFELRDRTLVPTPRIRHGQNHEARVEGEWVFVAREAPMRANQKLGAVAPGGLGMVAGAHEVALGAPPLCRASRPRSPGHRATR
jgi:hypothetical protein